MSKVVLQFRAVLTYGETGEKFFANWYSDKRCAVWDCHNISDWKHDVKYNNKWTIEERIIDLDAPEQLSLFTLKV